MPFLRTIPREGYLQLNVEVGNDKCLQKGQRLQFLEHVEIRLNLEFAPRGSLQVFLRSPRGNESNVIPKRENDILPAFFYNFTVDSVQFWGEDPLGNWTLKLQNFNPRRYRRG